MLNGKNLGLIGLIIISIVLLAFSAQRADQPIAVSPTPKVEAFESQTADLEAVTAEVTPKKLGSNEKENIFDVNFNTHSVDLDFDFAKVMVLRDDLGNSYKALGWSGGRGGHHLAGQITFPKIASRAKSVILEINLNSEKADLRWELY